jgi:hypothetical protein
MKLSRLNPLQHNNIPNTQSIKYSRIIHPTTPLLSPLITHNNKEALKSQRSSVVSQSHMEVPQVSHRHSIGVMNHV